MCQHPPPKARAEKGIRPGVGDKPWAMKQPGLLCKDPSPHQPLSELEPAAGASPCLASKSWAAPLSSTICVSHHLTPPHLSREHMPSATCVPTRGPLPYTLILKVPHTTDLPVALVSPICSPFLTYQPLSPLSGSAFLGPNIFKGFSDLPQIP